MKNVEDNLVFWLMKKLFLDIKPKTFLDSTEQGLSVYRTSISYVDLDFYYGLCVITE